ncbi:MAG: glycoside hydrolase family 2 protein [Pseudomonadota bacterium]
MGTLIWQLNDTWPVCSWSSLDYGGAWKLMHYMAKRFYQDVMVTAVPSGNTIELRAANDTPSKVPLVITAQAVELDGSLRDLQQLSTMVGGRSTHIMTLSRGQLHEDELLAVTWSGDAGNGREIFAPKPYKSYDLNDPSVSMAANGNTVTLSADGLSLFTTVEADCPGRFSDNAFDMLPGEVRQVTFTPTDPAATPTFTLRDLYSATMT